MDLNNLGAQAQDASFTLESFFDFDTSDIQALDSKLPVKGVHVVKITEPKMTISQSDDPAKPPLPRVGWTYEILEANPTDKEVDASALVGRKIKESATIWPDTFKDDIALIMGRYRKVGLPFQGRVGGNPEQEPGWLDSADEHIIQIRVRHFTNKEGVTRAGFDWLPFQQAEE